MSVLKGKVAIVTGASRGIGKSIAEVFARVGATVVICGRTQETLDEVAQEFSHFPGRVIPHACHVGRAEDIQALVANTLHDFERIDILVNNAGTNIAQGFCLSTEEAQFDKMIEVNVKSVYRFTQLVAPGMCRRGGGSIINVACIAGIRPELESLLYSMTKAALLMLTKSYALELGPYGVRVNAVAPGLVQTALSEFYWKNEERRDAWMARQPLPHLGQPAEIAEVVLMLASDRGSHITGQAFVIDGGMLIS